MRTQKSDGSMPSGESRRVRIEERDEVDVARIVELARAVFPHAEDEEAARLRRRRSICPRARHRRARSAAPRASAASAKSVSERGDRLERRSRRRGRRGRASAPHPAWRAAAPPSPRRASAHSAAASSATIRVDARFRRVGEDRRKPRDVLRGEIEEIGAVAERAAEEGGDVAGRRGSRRARCQPLAAPPPREAVPCAAAACGDGGSAAICAARAPQAARPAAAPGTVQDRGEARLVVAQHEPAAMQLRHRRDEAQAEPRAGLGAALLQPHEALGHARAGRPRRCRRRCRRRGASRRPRPRLTEITTSGFPLPSSAYLIALSTRLASAWLTSSRLRAHHHRPARLEPQRDARLLGHRLVELEHVARDARRRRSRRTPAPETPASARAISSSALKVRISWSASSIVACSASR